MKEFNKRNNKMKDPIKAKMIRNIFEIDDTPVEIAPITNKIKIEYNKTIYFKDPDRGKEDMNKYLSNVFVNNSKIHKESEVHKTEEPVTYHTIKAKNNCFHSKDKSNSKSDNSLVKNNNIQEIQLSQNTQDSSFSCGFGKTPTTVSTMCNTAQRSASNMIRSTNSKNNVEIILEYDHLLFVPCMNCGNNIPLNDIEVHSLKCTKVSEEVMKNETSVYELYPINYKLKRLSEHTLNISNGAAQVPKEFEKEMKYISTVLLQYIKDSLNLEIISLGSIKEFKKIIKNLETLSLTYKTSISSLILIDRTKVLVNEKLKIFRETFRIQSNTRKSNNNKTGYLEFENKIKEEIKKINQIKLETELEKTKVKNLRKSATPNDAPKINGINVKTLTESNIEDIYNDTQLEDEKNNDFLGNNKVDEIVSDIGNQTQVLSDNTSLSLMSDVNFNEGNSLNNSNIKQRNNKSNILIEDEMMINGEKIGKDITREKREFFKEVLKIKFEKLHSTHKGLHIPQKLIWEECQRLAIPRTKWTEFILSELNNPFKYSSKVISKSGLLGLIKPSMTIIDEEKM